MFSPQFNITAEMLNALGRIEVIREKIATCRIQPKAEYRLKQEALVSMVHHSTAIEGNPLSPLEVKRVLDGKSVSQSKRAIYEVQNYKKALDFIAKRTTPKITSRDILKIHRITTRNILPEESCGQFRKQPVYVVRRTPVSQEIRYSGPEHKKVPKLIENLCKWIEASQQKKLSPILIAGIAHAEIAAIHPFVDGNGRTARLLATLILYTEKYDFRKLFALENHYNTNRPAYYDAIHLGKTYQERQKSSLTNWLSYFVEGFLAEMELVLDKVRPLLYLNKTGAKPVVLSKEEIQIMDFLQEMHSATSKDIVDILSVSQRTAQRYLKQLLKKKVIKKRGTKKNARYEI